MNAISYLRSWCVTLALAAALAVNLNFEMRPAIAQTNVQDIIEVEGCSLPATRASAKDRSSSCRRLLTKNASDSFLNASGIAAALTNLCRAELELYDERSSDAQLLGCHRLQSYLNYVGPQGVLTLGRYLMHLGQLESAEELLAVNFSEKQVLIEQQLLRAELAVHQLDWDMALFWASAALDEGYNRSHPLTTRFLFRASIALAYLSDHQSAPEGITLGDVERDLQSAYVHLSDDNVQNLRRLLQLEMEIFSAYLYVLLGDFAGAHQKLDSLKASISDDAVFLPSSLIQKFWFVARHARFTPTLER